MSGRVTPAIALVAASWLAAAGPAPGSATASWLAAEGPAPPPTPTGRLTIRAVQGTDGGPPIGVADVTVRLHHQGMVVKTVQTRLDEKGVAVVGDLPLDVPVHPEVSVVYQDLTYQVVGPDMDAARAELAVDVECFERTETEPDWSVPTWHVMVDRTTSGIFVTEIVAVENPSDRTWSGRVPAGGRAETTVFTLPSEAVDVRLDRGFHDWCCTRRDAERLVNHLPLMPGTTEFKFTYHLPARGSASLTLVAPARVHHLTTLAPQDLGLRSTDGLEPMGSEQVGDRTIVAYAAHALERGATVALAVDARGPARDTSRLAKVVAGVAGAVLLLAAIVVFLRPRRTATEGAGP